MKKKILISLIVICTILIATSISIAVAKWQIVSRDNQNVAQTKYKVTLNFNNGSSNIVYDNLELDSYIYLPYASKTNQYFNGWKQNSTYYKGVNNELAFEVQVSTIKGSSTETEFTLTAEYVDVPTGFVVFKVFDGDSLIKQTLVENTETKFYVFNLNVETKKGSQSLVGFTTTSIKHYSYFNDEITSESIGLNDYFNISDLVANNASLSTITLNAVYE